MLHLDWLKRNGGDIALETAHSESRSEVDIIFRVTRASIESIVT